MISALMILGVSLILASAVAGTLQAPQRQAIRIEPEKQEHQRRRR